MTDRTQQAFRALADPTRRDILRMLSQQDMTIAQVSDRFDMTRAAVKKRLTVLSAGGLITVGARGREQAVGQGQVHKSPLITLFRRMGHAVRRGYSP